MLCDCQEEAILQVFTSGHSFLEELSLTNCDFSDDLPEEQLGSLGALRVVHLSHCRLGNSLPKILGQLPSLRFSTCCPGWALLEG